MTKERQLSNEEKDEEVRLAIEEGRKPPEFGLDFCNSFDKEIGDESQNRAYIMNNFKTYTKSLFGDF